VKNNIFIISDASYSPSTKCAGLGVVDIQGINPCKSLKSVFFSI